MGALFSYSLGVSVFLLCGYLAYKLFLAGEKQPLLNRFLLMAIYITSLVAIPLLAMEWGRTEPATSGTIELGAIAVSVIPSDPSENSMIIPRILLYAYIIGLIITSLVTLVAILRLALLLRRGTRVGKADYTLIILPKCDVPFSFGRYIVVGEGESSEVQSLIEAHEQAHLQCRHWLDLILAQGVCVLLWYNPVAWLMREELRQVHEYQADATVLSKGFDPYVYQMLLIKKAAGRRLQSLANSLNHSNLSKRITMMYKTENRALRSMRALALLPAIVLAALAVEQPAVATTIQQAGAASLIPAPVVAETVADSKVSENLSFDQLRDADVQSEEIAEAVTEAVAETVTETVAEAPVQTAQPEPKEDEALKAVAKMPHYPDGDRALMEFLMKNIRYPKDAMDAGAQGLVVVRFVIGKDGSINDPEIVRGQTESLNAEALRVVSLIPNFEPGRNENGEAVACQYTLPVNFRLEKDKPSEENAKVTVIGFRNTGKKAAVKSEKTRTYFVDGELFEGDLNSIPVERIESMEVIKNNPDYPDGLIMIKTRK